MSAEPRPSGAPPQPPPLSVEDATRMLKLALAVTCAVVAISWQIYRNSEPSFAVKLDAMALETVDPTAAFDPLAARDSCDGTECFDTGRSGCDGDIRFYVYPGAPMPSAEPARDAPLYEQLLWFLHGSGRLVADPTAACVLVPPFDTADGARDASVSMRLAALPHWDRGRNHLVLDFAALPCVRFDAGTAIRWRTRADDSCYWHHHDVVVPAQPLDLAAHSEPVVAPSARPHLVSFHGVRSTNAPGLVSRNSLVALHDPPYVVISTVCEPADAPAAFGCAASAARHNVSDWERLMQASKFAFLPPPLSAHEPGLLPLMRLGTIPIVLTSGFAVPILPLAETVHWEFLVFFADLAKADTVAEKLYSLPDESVVERSSALRAQAEVMFGSWSSMLAAAVNVTQSRVAAARAGRSPIADGLDIDYVYVLRDSAAS